jgi:hypothetical protein
MTDPKFPLFSEDTDGTQRKQKFIMGRRNWCQVDWNPKNGELVFDLRIEKEKGVGTTVRYVVYSELHDRDRTHFHPIAAIPLMYLRPTGPEVEIFETLGFGLMFDM